MTDDRGQGRGPLWRFVPRVAHVPQVRQLVGVPDDARGPREPGPNDLRPLRIDGEWRPSVILKRFGPMKRETEYLPRLVVACAVLGGVHRIREACERLVAAAMIAVPRVKRMVDEPSLERRQGTLKEILEKMLAARQDLPATKARATNDLDAWHPDGLREIDLEMLVHHTSAVVIGSEVATKRNLTGLDFAIHTATSAPEQRYVQDWLDRILGTASISGILLLTPRDYGRVVVVYDDGRLAYDPAAPADEDALED
ncbi:hypothetical protein L6R52_31795 [Myxococcota bacterium]|nr:hypothetical protein [Myxococcota bacterium]